jgi:hypothetical protein
VSAFHFFTRFTMHTQNETAHPIRLSDVVPHLAAPFPIAQVEIKPGSVSRDGGSALALAYCDWRLYAERLDTVVGPEHWSIELVPWGPTRVIARLTILGVTKDSSGEGDADDSNCGTIAEAQAKKRACAEFGLGRYFYHLPRLWGRGEGDRKSFRFADGEERRLVHEMYSRAGLTATAAPRREAHPTDADAAMPPPVTTAEEARTRLAEIHSRSAATSPAVTTPAPTRAAGGSAPGPRMITERQFKLLSDRAQLPNAQAQYGVGRLEELTFQQASALITALSPTPRPARAAA